VGVAIDASRACSGETAAVLNAPDTLVTLNAIAAPLLIHFNSGRVVDYSSLFDECVYRDS
jgi:hypothetical protein